jgi:hypothetical protein
MTNLRRARVLRMRYFKTCAEAEAAEGKGNFAFAARLREKADEDLISEAGAMRSFISEDLPALADAALTLADYLEEAHRDDIEHRHHGDPGGAAGCSYCQAIKAGRAAAKGV